MATAESVKSKINGLIAKANGKTGNTDSTLTATVDRLITGYGQGSGTGITPTGTITITKNGDYDVSSYANANVAIPEVEQAVPEITVNESGRIGYTITQEEGYVAGGTKFGSQTQPTQSAKTVTPGSTEKVAVAKGLFTTGDVKVAGDTNLIGENIKKGVSIFGITGVYEATGSNGEAEADDLSELHYWEKYVSGSDRVTETSVSNVTLSYKSDIGTNTEFDTVKYSEGITVTGDSLVLVEPVTTILLNSTNRDQIVGKYIHTTYDGGFYRIPSDATITYNTSTYNSSVISDKAFKLTAEIGGEKLGIVVSANSAAYPEDGEQDGYRYVYMGTLESTGGGDGTLPTLTNPGTATDLATGKQLIDGSGSIVTGSLFEVTSGNTLYGNNDPALSWRDDGKVETVGTYGVAGSGDGGIVRPGAKFAIRTPAEQYGNATAADVAAGKTFTSAAGLMLTGTGSGSSGLVMKTGTTTSNVIDTGLSEIQLLVIYNPSIAAVGLMQGIYRKESGKTNYTYCIGYSSTLKQFNSATDEKGVASGGSFTWNGTGSAVLAENTEYNWIAVGTA